MSDFVPPINRGRFQHKFGYNPDLDGSAAAEDITAFGNAYWPDAVVEAADIDIVSTSVQDKGTVTAGSGAQAILMKGLDADYREISETVILNGTTDVHPTLDYLRIHRVEVVKNAGAGAINAGVITIDIDGSNIMAQILAGFGQTTQCVYTIPANYTGWLLEFDVGMVALAVAKNAQGQLMVKEYDSGIWLVKHVFGISTDKDYFHNYEMNVEVKPKSDIRLRIFEASADNLFVSASMSIYLELNEV